MDGVTMSIKIFSGIQDQTVEHVFQPLWNITSNEIFGYEALVRFPKGFCDGNIEKAFELARLQGSLYNLDTLSIHGAVVSFPIHELRDKMLFINVYPSTLVNKQFETFIEQLLFRFPQISGKIVFELNETKKEEYIWNTSDLKRKVAFLKEKGFLVALDDIGKGAAELAKIIEFQPNFIKLDRYFAKDLSYSREKQQMLDFLVQYSKNRMVLVLEGIEEEVDLAQAKKLNVPVVQGYLLGRPQKLLSQPLPSQFEPVFLRGNLSSVIL